MVLSDCRITALAANVTEGRKDIVKENVKHEHELGLLPFLDVIRADLSAHTAAVLYMWCLML